MKNKQHRRSDCPINLALETFGDRWSLLIIRDMVYFGKKSYGEFLASDEGMATNILASRLVDLAQQGLLVKKPDETDKRKEVYFLTEKGLDLIPILLELASWSAQHDPHTAAPQAWIAMVNTDKEKMIKLIRETVQRGGSVFSGPNSVVRKLAGEGVLLANGFDEAVEIAKGCPIVKGGASVEVRKVAAMDDNSEIKS